MSTQPILTLPASTATASTGTSAPSTSTTTIVYAPALPDSFLAPTKFTGEATNVAACEDWLNYTKKYFKYRNTPEPEQIQLVSLLLSGAAADWFEALSTEDKSSMANFEKAFKQTYLTSDQHVWRSGIQLFETPQKPSESVDAYLARLQRIAKNVNISDELMQSILLHGIRPSTRSVVLMQGVKDLQTTIKNIRLAEANQPSDPSTSILLDIQRLTTDNEQKRMQQLETFKQEVQNQLKTQMQGLQDQLRQMNTMANINANVQDNSTPTYQESDESEYQMRPRQFATTGQRTVRFQRSSSPPPGRRPLKNTPKNQQRQIYRDSADRTNGPPPQQNRESFDSNRAYGGNQRRGAWGYDANQSYGGGQRRGPWNQQEEIPRCERCGRDSRHQRCTAIGKSCYACGGRDHLSSVCFVARRSAQ